MVLAERAFRAAAVRRVLPAAFAVYLLAVLYLTLSPRGGTAGSGVVGVVAALHAVGFPTVTDAQVEVALNVVLFLPFGVLGPLAWPRYRARTFVLAGCALSCFIEGFQASFLPHRVPSVTDLVANTAGALLGVLAVGLVRRELCATRYGGAADPPLLSRRAMVAAGLTLVLGVALLVFTPTPDIARTAVRAVADLMGDLGVPGLLASTTTWERLLNIALFVPVGFLGSLVRPGWSYARWAVLGLAASLAVELFQGVVLPHRDASVHDLVMNGIGMLLGAALTQPLRTRRRRPTTQALR